jgi:hypothetical protein
MYTHHNDAEEATMNTTLHILHAEIKQNSSRLADSIDNGDLGLHDAIIQALLADGFTFNDAVKALTAASLVYEVRRRAYDNGKIDGAL